MCGTKWLVVTTKSLFLINGFVHNLLYVKRNITSLLYCLVYEEKNPTLSYDLLYTAVNNSVDSRKQKEKNVLILLRKSGRIFFHPLFIYCRHRWIQLFYHITWKLWSIRVLQLESQREKSVAKEKKWSRWSRCLIMLTMHVIFYCWE